MIKKLSASLNCEPGFITDAFKSLKQEVINCPTKKDCCLVIDAMAIRSQSVWTPQSDKYVGFVDYGKDFNAPSDKLATEKLVFLLVGQKAIGNVQLDAF